jgi:hypothetical protein
MYMHVVVNNSHYCIAYCTHRLSRQAASISRRGLSRKEAAVPEKGGIFHWYNQCLEHNPILTKSLTSGVIALAGDVSCQVSE